ncbi:hypothetical protein [Flavobacterium psychrotrophum]|uniref:hypothetical protein n=1 Tax=Flavobacterium psychrotrophum TaxID=2294119 RepID=UPI000E30D4B1|nr:hypothetical protein [Flavobacterium psychrotrophum]
MKKYFIISLLGLTSIISGQSINKKYKALWAASLFKYQFKKDMTFSFIASGHIGNIKEVGKYELKRDTLLLTFDGISKPLKFVYDFQGKLIEIVTGYEYDEYTEEEGITKSAIKRVPVKIIVYDCNTKKRDTFLYYGIKPEGETNIKEQLYYFLNSFKILRKLEPKKIIKLSETSIGKLDATDSYDKNERLIEVFYRGSRISGIQPQGYVFHYKLESNQIVSITDNGPNVNSSFIFTNDKSNNLESITEKTKNNTLIYILSYE